MLKGQCKRFFASGFFHESVSPQPQSKIFFENSRRYSQIKVHDRYQRHQRQILPPVSLVLLILEANLPLVSTTQVAICHQYQQHLWQICYQCQWHQWQIMGTTSGCWDLQWTWRQKWICKLTILPKGVYTFMIEDFFHLPLVSTTPVGHLELGISPQICEKIWNCPNGILRGLGETDSWKNHKSKISWHCPFKGAHCPSVRFFDCSDFRDFYTIKPSWVGDFGTKI